MLVGNCESKHFSQSGFTLLAVLLIMTLLALGSSKVVSILATQAQRAREQELIRVGLAFQQAIGSYYESSPGTIKQWPSNFSDLTNDKRFVGLRRYLRKVYEDPITRSTEWGIVRAPNGGIQGVYSLSDQKPLKTAGLPAQIDAQGSSYQSWRFIYTPSAATQR